jgi:hypothetical protein
MRNRRFFMLSVYRRRIRGQSVCGRRPCGNVTGSKVLRFAIREAERSAEFIVEHKCRTRRMRGREKSERARIRRVRREEIGT